MAMEQTWRWFGPSDPITLKDVKQTGAAGVVTALHHIPPGEAWSVDEIMKRAGMIKAEGLTWPVVESVPVSESIKTRQGDYFRHIENFKATLRNLGRCSIPTICYNFMPVLDWSRTELDTVLADGSVATRFDPAAFIAFDVFILQRPGAEASYGAEEVAAARKYYGGMDEAGKERLQKSILLGFPGADSDLTLGQLRKALVPYGTVGDRELRANLGDFLREIIPVAEDAGVLMAIHPDDPPRSLLGLPRVVSNARDIEDLLAVVDSPSNGLTLCTGSLGAGKQNDLAQIAKQFAHRLNFVHLRNVCKDGTGGFIEEDHLEGDIDMYSIIKTVLLEQKRRAEEGRKDVRIPMRPDHGHTTSMDSELARIRGREMYPGYSLVGRMRGLAELRGLELGIRRTLGL